MAEWVVEVFNLIPMGSLEERLCIFRVDRATDTFAQVNPMVVTEGRIGDSVDMSVLPFLKSASGSVFGRGEVDQFLQAMLDTAWRRGLRPAKFDPSAGELAAVKAHLDDMRRLAKVPDDGPQNVQAMSDEKKW